jgi:two-component system NtrC family sensor kinase
MNRSSTERPAVLIVDDTEANLVALEALLEDCDCETVRARSGNDALRFLLKREFAVMLLDVHMPGMDGYEVATYARKNPATRDVPIIFLTATHRTEANVLRGYGTGAVDFLFKPLDPFVLRGKVSVFLELYAARRQISDAKAQQEIAFKDLQETQAQLVQSAKMASLGSLVAGVAHEINNPLAFVMSHLDTVLRSLATVDEETRGALSERGRSQRARADARLQEMKLGLERIADLVVKLRTFSRKDEGELKRVSVRESVESLLTILAHRTRSGIRIDTRYGDPDVIECYPSLLNQAVMNLVTNSIDAIDAIDGSGTITISTGAANGAFRIVVEDTGCGIPSELRERVLEPFFTTKPVGKGTGLGLSITYSIVERHGGTLELASGRDGGTSAILTIPMNRGERR